MENWDEKKLEEVVNKKHGEAEKKKPKTQIVRPFLDRGACLEGRACGGVCRCSMKSGRGLDFVLEMDTFGYRVKFLFRSRL